MPVSRVSFTWSARRDGNNGWVLEEAGPLWRKEFGPLPPHTVPAFINARRRLIAMKMEALGAEYVLEDPNDLFTSRNPAQETRNEHPGNDTAH